MRKLFFLNHLNHGALKSMSTNSWHHTAHCHSTTHPSCKDLPLACIPFKKSFLVQINSACPRWDLPTQAESQCLSEPSVGKDIDDRVAGWVEVSKPDKDVEDQWWCDEVKEAVNQRVNGEGKPAQEVNAHSNAQGLGSFSFTFGSPGQVFAQGDDLLSLPCGNHKNLHIQADHDEAGEKEHRKV